MKLWPWTLLNCTITGNTLTPTLPFLMLPTPTKPKLSAVKQRPPLTTLGLFAYPSKPTLTNIPAPSPNTVMWSSSYRNNIQQDCFKYIYIYITLKPWHFLHDWSFFPNPSTMQYIQPSMALALSAWRDANFGKIISDFSKTVSSPVFQFGTTRVKAHPFLTTKHTNQ